MAIRHGCYSKLLGEGNEADHTHELTGGSFLVASFTECSKGGSQMPRGEDRSWGLCQSGACRGNAADRNHLLATEDFSDRIPDTARARSDLSVSPSTYSQPTAARAGLAGIRIVFCLNS